MTDKLPAAKFPPWKEKEEHVPMNTHLEMDRLGYVTKPDMVNSPPHYNRGKFEAIDVIEDAVQHAPDSIIGGLQWQVLKYVLRMWHKTSALEDAKKARWYLDRLINKLERK